MMAVTLLAILIGSLISMVGGLWFMLVIATEGGVLWFVGSLLFSPVQLVFLMIHWKEAKTPFFVYLIGTSITLTAVMTNPLIRDAVFAELGMPGSPAVEVVEEPVEEPEAPKKRIRRGPVEVHDEIWSYKPSPNVYKTVYSYEEVPEEFRDSAVKLRGTQKTPDLSK